MPHYRDMAFCDSDCVNRQCSRNLTEKVQEEAIRWWGGNSAPVAVIDFSSTCASYTPEEPNNGQTTNTVPMQFL